MKRRQMMLRTLAVSMFLFLSAGADAQGVIIHKKYGAPIKVPFAELDSISTYDYEDETPIENGHKYVDLGLPSGTLWATCNVGAENPEDYGDYFAWGETEPYYMEGYAQSKAFGIWKTGKSDGYYWSSYKWCNGSFDTMTKYCTQSSYGTVDNKTVLDPEDDAAHVQWGGNWRMPTYDELNELKTQCIWEWTQLNGVNGYKVSSKQQGNTNYLFLPAAGYRSNSSLGYVGSYGYYWSSSLSASRSFYAYGVYFDSSNVDCYSRNRCYGQSVRPVCVDSHSPQPKRT